MAPLLLLQICIASNDISIPTPALWTAIRLQSPAVEHLQTWLGRARNQTLSVSLNNGLTNETATLLGKAAEQLKNLEICGSNLGSGLLISAQSFPHRETLTIEAISRTGCRRSEVLRLLRISPNLVKCTLYNTIRFGPRSPLRMQQEFLPRLMLLTFGKRGREETEDLILRNLTLPALETLVCDLHHHSGFRNLVIDDCNSKLGLVELEVWLQLVPTLMHLSLRTYNIRRPLSSGLVAALERAPCELLPNLQKLKIRQRGSLDSYTTLLSALTLRRNRITFCDLETSDINSEEPGCLSEKFMMGCGSL
ncbi:hypothetical protein C8F04DRAFT_1295739 [Mycena alexandri]|uniref:Uncharacterized protein n=1 Tax=Mycena alexandri TaxID=1745969 RepID=A0AAD6WZQ0_9AGAR|nr:hypothetical protein C8F04DRAFT_1295739 [Mycena alexandri]